MSKKYSIKKGCGAKQRFVTPELAKEALNTRMEFQDHKEEMNVYFCEFCHYWHLGHKKGLLKEREQKRQEITKS